MNTLPAQAGYSSYVEEIERRVEASKQGESKLFDKVVSSGSDLPYELTEQRFVVFSLSTGIPPKAIDPATRVQSVGMFSLDGRCSGPRTKLSDQ